MYMLTLNKLIARNENEQIRIEQKGGAGKEYLDCRIWIKPVHEWYLTEHVVIINISELVTLSGAVDILKGQDEKATQEDEDWKKRFDELTVLLGQERKKLQENISIACSELSKMWDGHREELTASLL